MRSFGIILYSRKWQIFFKSVHLQGVNQIWYDVEMPGHRSDRYPESRQFLGLLHIAHNSNIASFFKDMQSGLECPLGIKGETATLNTGLLPRKN